MVLVLISLQKQINIKIKTTTDNTYISTENLSVLIAFLSANTELYLSFGSNDIDFDITFFNLQLILLDLTKASMVLPMEYISERKSVC